MWERPQRRDSSGHQGPSHIRDIERSRCVRNRPVARGRRSRALRVLRSRPPSPKFPCSPPPDLCPPRSPPAPGGGRPCQQLRPAPCPHSSSRRFRVSRLRRKKFAVRIRAPASGCRSSPHRPDTPIPAGFRSPRRQVFPHCCAPPSQRSPCVPGCRAPLYARSRRSIRSRPEQRRVYVSFLRQNEQNLQNDYGFRRSRLRLCRTELFLKLQTLSAKIQEQPFIQSGRCEIIYELNLVRLC